MIYIICFFLSSFIIYITQNKKRGSIQGCIIAVFILSILAGLRAHHIGTDTIKYPFEAFEAACATESFFDLFIWTQINLSMKEIGYVIFVYISSLITNDFNVFLFLTALVINSGICYFLYKESKRYKISMAIAWLSYCFMFYNQTLNIAKQSIAIAICLIAYVCYKNNRHKKYILLQSIALTFHFTSIISFFYIFEEKIKSSLIRWTFVGIAIAGSLGFIAIMQHLFSVIPYLNRFSSYLANNDGDLALFEIAYHLMIFMCFYVLFQLNLIRLSKILIKRILYIFIVEISLFSMNALSAQAGRTSLFILPFYFIFIPLLIKHTKYKKLLTPLYILTLLLFWIITIIIQGATETYPYETI